MWTYKNFQKLNNMISTEVNCGPFKCSFSKIVDIGFISSFKKFKKFCKSLGTSMMVYVRFIAAKQYFLRSLINATIGY